MNCARIALLAFVIFFGNVQADKDDVDVLDYSISGTDFHRNFMTKSKFLLIKNAASTWPLHEQLKSNQLAPEIEAIKVTQLRISHDDYGQEETNVKDFIEKSVLGVKFLQNVTDGPKELFDAIEVPVMILSCSDLYHEFKKSFNMFLRVSKTKKYTETDSLACFPRHTFIALLKGKATMTSVKTRQYMKLNDGDILYIPAKNCMKISASKLAFMASLSWTQPDMESVKCKAVPLYVKGEAENSQFLSEDQEAQPHRLNTGYMMPPVGFGTARLATDTYSAVSKALEVGYRLIDTAQLYQATDEVGSEVEVGRAIADSAVKREDIFIVTKVNPIAFELTKHNTLESLEQSLENLQTDYIDLVLIHDPYGACETQNCEMNFWKAWEAMEELKAEGKIRSLGICNVYSEQELDTIVSRVNVAVLQNYFEPFRQDKIIRKKCEELGIVYMGYSTLGLMWIEKTQGEGMSYNPVLQHPLIKELGLATDIPPATAILRWAMHRNVVVIPSSANPDHIETNYFSYQMSVPKNMLTSVDSMDGMFTENDVGMTYDDFVTKFSVSPEELAMKLYPEAYEDEEDIEAEEETEQMEGGGGLPDDYTVSGKDEL